MCGISGCLTQNEAMTCVVKSLTRLQNRGYDSAGVAHLDRDRVIVQKSVSKPGRNAMEYLHQNCMQNICHTAIGHTRWATHGAKTVANAHPHHDDDMQIALVHNGIIENYDELRRELFANNYQFYGETDTEILTKYLHFMMQRGEDYQTLSQRIHGAWAILFVLSQHPDRIYFMRRGSPLLFGYNKTSTKIMFVSEVAGFDADIVNYFTIRDDDSGYVFLTDVEYHMVCHALYETEALTMLTYDATPHPYQHWTLREIHDQTDSIDALLNIRMRRDMDTPTDHYLEFSELLEIQQHLDQIEHIIFLGCGTSLHAANIGMKFFRQMNTKMTTETIDGGEFRETDIPKRHTLLVLVSQSGETRDLGNALTLGKALGIKSVGIINVENSMIAKGVDVKLYLHAGRENAVASTKSFTNQVVMLIMFALWMNRKNISAEDFQRYLQDLNNLSHEYATITRRVEADIHNLTMLFRNQTSCFVLGKDTCEIIAQESALKIKEISYIHAEAYSASALKHGPFAILHDGVPVVIIANDDITTNAKIDTVVNEIKSRHAKVILVSNRANYHLNADYHFYHATSSLLFPLIAIVPMQILAYYLSLERTDNPDYPRNLAKVVTVE